MKALKQLRVKNYKVKLTEIDLSPSQTPPDCFDNCKNGSLEHNESERTPKYNVRQEIRKDYKAMDEGTGVIDIAHTKESKTIMPPKYAWDSFETDDEYDDFEANPSIVTQFESWCSQQPRFMPPSSIFIHWFKDKYPTMDTKKLQSLALLI